MTVGRSATMASLRWSRIGPRARRAAPIQCTRRVTIRTAASGAPCYTPRVRRPHMNVRVAVVTSLLVASAGCVAATSGIQIGRAAGRVRNR